MNTLPSSANSLPPWSARTRSRSGRCADCTTLVAGVQQHEAAGAVGVLRHAGAVAGLAEHRRLLVAGDAADDERLAEDAGAAACRRRAPTGCTSGRIARGTSNSCSSSGSHSSMWMLKSSVREAFETSVTWVRLPVRCQVEPGVHRAESELAALGARPRAGNVVEQPRDLGAAEIRIDHQAGALAHQALGADLASTPRTAARCAGPARRWRCGSARRSAGPRRWWFRAGW